MSDCSICKHFITEAYADITHCEVSGDEEDALLENDHYRDAGVLPRCSAFVSLPIEEVIIIQGIVNGCIEEITGENPQVNN